MSRHLGKIIDIVKNEEGFKVPKYGMDADEKTQKPYSWQELDQHFKDGNDVSEQEYMDILSGEYPNLSTSWLNSYSGRFANRAEGEDENRRVGDIINQSKHNNHVINQKILDKVYGESKRGTEYSDEHEEMFAHLAKRGDINGKTVGDFMDGKYIHPDEREYNNILKNPKITPQHIEKFVQMRPNEIETAMEHPKFDESSLERLISGGKLKNGIDGHFVDSLMRKRMGGYDYHGEHKLDEEQTLDLNPRVVRSLLEDHHDGIKNHSLNILLDHAEPTFKKQWTDEKLGITNGSYGHTEPDEGGFQEENWNNWASGDKMDSSVAKFLAGSRHIDDDQAEHIKRHADIEDKYALYHNTKVDPRHGVEMFQKWHNDEDNHGYDAEDLHAQYKHHKDEVYSIDDLDETEVEEIRQDIHDTGDYYESAEQEYTMHDWVNDHGDEYLANNPEAGGDVDIDKTYETLHEDHDWEGENPEFHQHSGNPDYVALNKLNDAFEGGHITSEELKETTGLNNWSKLGLEPDSDGEVHSSEVLDKLNEDFNGPETIDYANHDEYSINEHPEFDDRFAEAHKQNRKDRLEESPWDFDDDIYSDYRESEGFMNAESEAVDEMVKDRAGDKLQDLYDTSHQDTRFIPDHLHPHIPNFETLQSEQKTRISDGGNRKFLNEHIKDRDYEHHYGDDQHYYEMVKDHAEANNGKIDVGTMNKLYPAQKEKWKKVFGGKGKLTHDEATQKLDELPKTKYDISYGKWGAGNMQNINNQNQIIFRLDHSNESLKPLMEDPALYETFKKVQSVSKQSGHPTKDNTIAWARVDTSDPKHWMIDEVQSDFGKTVTKYLKNEGADEKASHVDAISAHHKNWRESLTNAVLKEAKRHGAGQVSTHSPESKANHTSSSKIHSVYKDSYKKVPRSMGFKASHHEDLPLTDKGKQNFQTEDSPEAGGGTKDLGGHTFNLTPSLLKKHMDDCLEYLEALEKGELGQAAKGAVLALGLGLGAHQMTQDANKQATEQFAQQNAPKHARSAASQEIESDPVQVGYEEAKKEAGDIIYKNDKKWFIDNHSNGLSHHVYKQTIKNDTELNQKYGYTNKLSNKTFKEIIEKNPHLREDVHATHYDKLHKEFGGDHEQMLHAWSNGIKATNKKFSRDPANVSKLGEQPSQDIVDKTIKESPKTP